MKNEGEKVRAHHHRREEPGPAATATRERPPESQRRAEEQELRCEAPHIIARSAEGIEWPFHKSLAPVVAPEHDVQKASERFGASPVDRRVGAEHARQDPIGRTGRLGGLAVGADQMPDDQGVRRALHLGAAGDDD